ncbi:MAG: mitochondrial fission ELM1 family protein [Deltaproteobacteria bacterium]|nr:mitochondrial fission ELM1 family protein [Deltaproteobacteria bacterium]
MPEPAVHRTGRPSAQHPPGERSPGDRSRPGQAPRVWLLMGHRAGDNSQVEALGEAIGWPFEIKRFVYQPWERLVNLPFASTLAGVVKERSSALGPPWPDLVISAGRRNEPIARWIRNRSDAPMRLVHVGRPWAALESWDLVVTTPQYRLPRLANVLHNETPLHRVTPERLQEAAALWEERLAHLPRPRVVVLAGGPSGPYPFDARSGARLARDASALAARAGGSLLVTTSARTPREAIDALFRGVSVPSFLYRWRPGDPDNPYFGFLGLADQLVVTGDSVSMMTEACVTGRPVFLFDTGEGRFSMRERDEAGPPWWHCLDRAHLNAVIYRIGMRWGPTRWTRDIRIVQKLLVASGRAAWLGEGAPAEQPPPLRDIERAAARVRALFEPVVLPPPPAHAG